MCVCVCGHPREGKRMVMCIVQNGLSFRSYMYAYSHHISMSALYMYNITTPTYCRIKKTENIVTHQMSRQVFKDGDKHIGDKYIGVSIDG